MNQKLLICFIAMCLPLAACQVKPGGSADPEQLGAEAVRDLFVGKTVESYSLSSGATSFTYYAPDGTVQQNRFWGLRTGEWMINANGEMCLSMEAKPSKCRPIFELDGRYYKYRSDTKGKLQKIIRYRQFVSGNKL